MTASKSDSYLREYNQRLQAAEEMLPIIGALWRDCEVPTYVYGQPLHLKGPVELLKAHRQVRQILGRELSSVDTIQVLKALRELAPRGIRVDVGKLSVQYSELNTEQSLTAFVAEALQVVAASQGPMRPEPQDVILYGFGRVGRLLARILVERMGGGGRFRLRGIVTRPGKPGDLEKRASLLRRDSVHGPFPGIISLDKEENAIVINGNLVPLIEAKSPDEADYAKYGIKDAVVIDNTGKWRDREGLGLHLKSGCVSKVILTAPAKGDIPNIVYGVNNHDILPEENVLSAASCTTNAIAPVLKAVHEQFGIINGHVQTSHAYTNDQNLIDNFHNKKRRGRSAALNMVITETGAAKAVSKALPELAGKLTANAIRVPTPNVSLAIMSMKLDKGTTRDELNAYLRDLSMEGPMQYQIDYVTSPDIVSSDLVGNRHASIVDSDATIMHGDSDCVLYVWYDNEFGYACQVVRLLENVAGVRSPVVCPQ
ncbi:MAG: glyceraldehyde-3-phosphate dehydrogenase [Myxococcota bacterium]|nr:glyceraldehyde-3-phosphate dehydrogenase [Myxococcota bacterium]